MSVVGVVAATRRLFLLPAFAASRLEPSRDQVAWVVGALFALHPIQTQPVNYIVQRAAVLAAALCIAAFWAYLRSLTATEGPARFGWLASALTFLGAAMLAKQNAIAFPLVLAVFDLLFVRRGRRARAALLVPLALVVAIVPAIQLHRVAVTKGTADLLDQATEIGGPISRTTYFLTEWRVIVSYLRLLVAPVGLNLEHDVALARSPFEPAVLASGLFLAALLALAVFLAVRRRLDPGWRLAGFGLLWFFSCLSVESTLLPIADPMFEHRLYLPSVGFFLAAVAALTTRGDDLSRRRRLVALAALATLLEISTAARNRVWADERTFWYDVLAKSPAKPRVLYNVGFLELRDGHPERAREYFGRAVERQPSYLPALVQLADLARRRGDIDRALDYYRRASAVDGANWRILVDLRSLRLNRGEIEQAAQLWHRIVELAGGEAPVRELLREIGAEWALPENVDAAHGGG